MAAVTATLTADNYYVLYHGSGSSSPTLVGHDRDGPGRSSWQTADTWNFSSGASKYIYVNASNSDQIKMFIGSFVIDGRRVQTNAASWEVFEGNISNIPTANWTRPVSLAQGVPDSQVWGTFGGINVIDASANFIWSRGFNFNESGQEVVFRTPVNASVDIGMLSAQLQNANTVQFTYDTTGTPGPFQVGLYRSANGTTFNPADIVGSLQTVTPSSTNPQSPGTITLPNGFAYDSSKPYLIVVADPNNAILESNEGNNAKSFILSVPDIAMQSAQLLPGNSAQFIYGITGNPGTFQVGLFRSANGTTYNSGDLVGSLKSFTPSPLNPQAPGTIALPSNYLQDPAKPFLLVVADPNNSINETNESNNFSVLVLPDIRISETSATSVDSKSVNFEFQVVGAFVTEFQVAVYRSRDMTLDATDIQIGNIVTVTVPNQVTNPATIPMLNLSIDPSHPYVFVKADPQNQIVEQNEDNNSSHFRKWTLGFVTHGLAPFGGLTPLGWMDSMKNALTYDFAYAFNWSSSSNELGSGRTEAAGLRLKDEILSRALSMPIEPNDVIDLHVIGQSRFINTLP